MVEDHMTYRNPIYACHQGIRFGFCLVSDLHGMAKNDRNTSYVRFIDCILTWCWGNLDCIDLILGYVLFNLFLLDLFELNLSKLNLFVLNWTEMDFFFMNWTYVVFNLNLFLLNLFFLKWIEVIGKNICWRQQGLTIQRVQCPESSWHGCSGFNIVHFPFASLAACP